MSSADRIRRLDAGARHLRLTQHACEPSGGVVFLEETQGAHDESRRSARGEQAAGHRGRGDQQAGPARGADPHRLCRPVPLRSAFHRGALSASAARGAGARVRPASSSRSAPRSPTSRRATTSSPACRCSAAPARTAPPAGRPSAPTPASSCCRAGRAPDAQWQARCTPSPTSPPTPR